MSGVESAEGAAGFTVPGGTGSAYVETAEAPGRVFSHVDSFDAGPARTDPAERDRPLDRVAGPFEDRLHAAVSEVSHPTGYTLGLREGFGRSAEVHALNAARHHHASADPFGARAAQSQSPAA